MSELQPLLRQIILITLLCVVVNNGHANQALITEDFDFGTWTPFSSRWQKSVPVCVWDETNPGTSFRIEATGFASRRNFRLSNDIDVQIPYRVHWSAGPSFRRNENLRPGTRSSGIFTSQDTSRCASGPTGLLRVTINSNRLQSAEPGIYSDTIVLTISPL